MTIELVRLPPDIEQGAKGGPEFATSIVALSSGAEQRNATWAAPLARWDIGYGISTKEDYAVVRDFFYARRGRQSAFLFKDWSDYEAQDEVIGTGDGLTRAFALCRNYTLGDASYRRLISRPVADTVEITVDGVAAEPDTYTIGEGGWIRFDLDHVPADGQVVRWSGEFDIPVRFDVDQLSVTAILENVGEIDSIPVREVRDPINNAPTAINLLNAVTSLDEKTSTATRIKVADIDIEDDPFGKNVVTLSGTDAEFFEVEEVGTNVWSLYIKAGVDLDYEAHPGYTVVVSVDDELVTPHPAATATYVLLLNDINEPPSITLENRVLGVAEDLDTSSPVKIADIVVSDDALGTNTLSLSGPDAATFEITGSALYIKAGTTFDTGVQDTYQVTVEVDDPVAMTAPGVPASHPCDSVDVDLAIGVIPSSQNIDGTGNQDWEVPLYNKLTITMWGPGGGASGAVSLATWGAAFPGTDATDTTIASLNLVAGGGKAGQFTTSSNYTATQGGAGGLASGGDVNDNGEAGGNGLVVHLYWTYWPAVIHFDYGPPPNPNSGPSGRGGNAPGGGLGGAAQYFQGQNADYVRVATAGQTPGGGCGGGIDYTPQSGWLFWYPGGGSGARVRKTFLRGDLGAPEVGSVLQLHVGTRGACPGGVLGGVGRIQIEVE